MPPSFIEDSSFSCGCRLYYASKPTDVPPVVWEPCGALAPPSLSGTVCKRMVVNFPRAEALPIVGVSFDPLDSRPRYAFRRMLDAGQAWGTTALVVAEDGSIETAVTTTGKAGTICSLDGYSSLPVFRGDQVAFSVNDTGGATPYHVAGYELKGAALTLRYEDTASWHMEVALGSDGLWLGLLSPAIATVAVTGPGVLGKTTISPSLPSQPYNGGLAVVAPGAIFFNRFASGRLTGIYRWTAPGPQEPWRVEPNPAEKAPSDFATDGKDMVWLENSFGGDAVPEELWKPFTHRQLMTAKYAAGGPPSDARKVTRDPAELGGEYAVYCGYAARTIEGNRPDGSRFGAVFVVRLADGVSWTLESTPFDPSPTRWWWVGGVALTCEELMVSAGLPSPLGTTPSSTIFRVRLDSLGPGKSAE